MRVHIAPCVGPLLLLGVIANPGPAMAIGVTCFAWLPDGPEVPCTASQPTGPFTPGPRQHTPQEISRDLNAVGIKLLRDGDPQGAIAKFREAISADPGNNDARGNYFGATAMQLDDAGDLGNALANASEAARFDSSWSGLADKINAEIEQKRLEVEVAKAVDKRRQRNADQRQEDVAIAVRRRRIENERRNLDAVNVAAVTRKLETLASRQADSILTEGVACYDGGRCVPGDGIPRFVHRGSGSLSQRVLAEMTRDAAGRALLNTESSLSNQFAKSIWEQAILTKHLQQPNDDAKNQNLEVHLTNARDSVKRTAQGLAGAMSDVEKEGMKYVVKLE